MAKRLGCILLFSVLCGSATARTLTVRQDGSGDYLTIQEALDATVEGDTVSIGPGRYLESGLYVLPGGERPDRVFAYVRTASLTMVGSGMGETVIGPESYDIDPEYYTYGIVSGNAGGILTLMGVTVVNCFAGITSRGDSQDVEISNCGFQGNENGVYSNRMQGRITNCYFWGGEVDLLDFGIGMANGQTVLDVSLCTFDGLSSAISIGPGANGSHVRDCNIQSVVVGVDLWSVEGITVVDNDMTDVSNIGIAVEGLDHVIRTNDVESAGGALAQYNTHALIEQNRFSASGYSAVYIVARPPYLPTYVANDLSRSGTATLARMHVFSTDEPYHLAMTDHYWGYTVADSISTWILDGKDDPEELGFIDFEPFATESVENETRSMGGLKSMFR